MSGAPFLWQPDPAELLSALPVTSMSSAWLREQADRFESTDGEDVGADIVSRPEYLDGTALWVESPLEAMLLRDALRHLGYVAERVWDLGSAADDDAAHVVVTSRPFLDVADPRADEVAR